MAAFVRTEDGSWVMLVKHHWTPDRLRRTARRPSNDEVLHDRAVHSVTRTEVGRGITYQTLRCPSCCDVALRDGRDLPEHTFLNRKVAAAMEYFRQRHLSELLLPELARRIASQAVYRSES